MFSNSAVPLTGSQSGISNKLVAPQNAMVQTKFDFLALNDLDSATLVKLLERTQRLASFWKERRMPQSLAGKRIGLVVNDTGWEARRRLILAFSPWAAYVCTRPCGGTPTPIPKPR